ncbi:DUF1801 domain-containing protein [Pseudahrensia aquimaris]|uniref:DUF1801 domain-containing protein n=1 Tax=Pseudahrensia aquimaris TaxID=744461 RepID=A0ABW3FFU4_9HYPH
MEKQLRKLILETAAATPDVGQLAESVKWAQPSFTPKKANVGSSVRIQQNRDDTFGLMFICHTNLVQRFRELYEDELTFEANRAIVISPDDDLANPALTHCIAMALRYKLDKR